MTWTNASRWTIVAAAATVLAACGGDGPPGSAPSVPASPTETASPTPTATGTNGGGADLELEAEDIAFQSTTLSAPAGASVALEFKNRDDVPHNFALYRTEAADDRIFSGEPVTGPDAEVVYEFDAPAEAGTYFFRCDIHPDQMTGDFIVE